MSEASRVYRLRLANLREELESRHGPVEETETKSIDVDPSWGPVGSLAKQLLSPVDYEHMLQLHADMLARARAAQDAPVRGQEPPPPVETAEEPPAQTRVLDASEALLQLDRFGETPLYACPQCGEESAKASTALGVWHCTACGQSGWIQKRTGMDRRQLPSVPLHDV